MGCKYKINGLELTKGEFLNYVKKQPLEESAKILGVKMPPSAPFINDTNKYVQLGLRVALKEAVKQGADKIAWTTGEQQNDRYDLSKQVDEILYFPSLNEGVWDVSASKNNKQIWGELADAKRIEAVLGKDIADKIIKGDGEFLEKGNRTREDKYPIKALRGIDLKVGGKGMKGFYGSPTEGSLGIVGNVAKSLFKQEPKTVKIKTGEQKAEINWTGKDWIAYNDTIEKSFKTKEDAQEFANYLNSDVRNATQHSIDVTPELKAEVESGLPQFSIGGRVSSISERMGKSSSGFNPSKNSRDFIDSVSIVSNAIVSGDSDEARDDAAKLIKAKIGSARGAMGADLKAAVAEYVDDIVSRFGLLSPSDVSAVNDYVLSASSVSGFEKSLGQLVRFGKKSPEWMAQMVDLLKSSRPSIESSSPSASSGPTPISSTGAPPVPPFGSAPSSTAPPAGAPEALSLMVGAIPDREDGEVLRRITAITTDTNQNRSKEEKQVNATYVEEKLDRLRNIGMADAAALARYFGNSPDWIDKVLDELEADSKSDKKWNIVMPRMVGLLNVLNNMTYEAILAESDPQRRNALLETRGRLDAFTNDYMRNISLALGSRRSDAHFAAFARGGGMSDAAMSSVLGASKVEQINRMREAMSTRVTNDEMSGSNVSSNDVPPSSGSPKDSKKSTKDNTFEANMKNKAAGVDKSSLSQRAADLRSRLFDAIKNCK